MCLTIVENLLSFDRIETRNINLENVLSAVIGFERSATCEHY